jgi:hypothetical protein
MEEIQRAIREIQLIAHGEMLAVERFGRIVR